MSAKVAPLPVEALPEANGALGSGKCARRSRVYKAMCDVYEFDGWARLWLACLWFVVAVVGLSYRYPAFAGTFHSMVKAQMTAYDLPNGTTSDVRSASTFYDGLKHAMGFLTVYADKADRDGHPDGMLPITEYDRIVFARLEVDFKSNCLEKYDKLGFSCYTRGIDPGTNGPLDPETLAQFTASGYRKVALLNPNVTRDQLRSAVATVLDSSQLLFVSTYAFQASLLIGVVNEQAGRYLTVYLFTVSRKTNNAIGSQAFRNVVTKIDNVDVRDMPLYVTNDDFIRAPVEIISVIFLLGAVWNEVLQFNMCRAWRNLHLNDHQRRAKGSGWRRAAHLAWFFFAQPFNVLDAVAILNYTAYWIVYVVLLVRSQHTEVRVVQSVEDFDRVQSLADLHLQHLVWAIFTNVLVGLRVLPYFKTQAGLSVYSLTLKISWDRLKDLLLFFGYVFFVMCALISPLFELTGANTLFRDTGTSILNLALITFQYIGFQDFFANNAPTFGAYWIIFMFFFAFCVLLLVVISQNVLLALVAAAYDEARETVGAAEFNELRLSIYRVWWIGYSRMHRWLLRKSPYDLAEELIAATSRPDVWFYQHIFVRWALADLPETRVLAQLYMDPAAEVLYMYSPWAWDRTSPWDDEQQAPWDQQLDYPMYGWEDVPVNEPGVRPRLRRMPPLFSRSPADGRTPARGRLPVAYSEADDLFAMTEDEVDDILECAEWCWGRMRRYPVVGRLSGLGWSERGQRLLREGLLEVYRRHHVSECTSTSVAGGGTGGSGSGSLVAVEEPPTPTRGPGPAVKTAGSATRLMPASTGNDVVRLSGGDNDTPADGDDVADVASAAALQRNRQFSLFNRRGRIAENLDMLWGEIWELRQQQGEIKALLELVLRQQQQQQQQAQQSSHQPQLQQQQQPRNPAAGPGSVSRSANTAGGAGGNGGLMRGAAALPSERPASGQPRGQGPWEWGEQADE